MDEYDSGGGGPGGDRPARSRGINPEKLQNVDQKKKIPIFYHSDRNTTDYLYPLFPLEGVTLFCNKVRDSVQKDKAVYLPDGDTVAWRAVFDWIQRCLDNGAIEDFEVSDEYSPGVFSRYADIVKAAEYLEVPDRDVAEKVMKRMKTMARAQRGEGQDRRVTFEELEDFYENRSEELAKIASLTVFHSWWNWHLSGEDTLDEMCELGALREDYPDLDQDLHDHVTDYDNFKKAMKAKRDAEENGTTDSGCATGTGGGWADNKAASGAVGGWDDAAPAAVSGGWNAGPTETAATGNWNSGAANGHAAGNFDETPTPAPAADYGEVVDENNKENVAPAEANADWDQGGEGNDWADEVNDSAPAAVASAW